MSHGTTEQKIIVGIGLAIVLTLVLVIVIPGPTANAAALVRGAPPQTPITADQFATLQSDREFFAHTETAVSQTDPMKKLPRGQRLKVVETFPETMLGRRLYRAYTMTGELVDTGSFTRGYLYLSAAELA